MITERKLVWWQSQKGYVALVVNPCMAIIQETLAINKVNKHHLATRLFALCSCVHCYAYAGVHVHLVDTFWQGGGEGGGGGGELLPVEAGTTGSSSYPTLRLAGCRV